MKEEDEVEENIVEMGNTVQASNQSNGNTIDTVNTVKTEVDADANVFQGRGGAAEAVATRGLERSRAAT